MKKLLAALLAAILAGSGLSIVDSELTNRVDVLEQQNIEQTSQIDELNKKIDELTSKVNEMQQNIPQGEKEYKVGDLIKINIDQLYHYGLNSEKSLSLSELFDELNISGKIVNICTDPTDSNYYSNKYTVEFTISGKVSQQFFPVCAWKYMKPVDGYACNFNIINDKDNRCIVLDLKDKHTNTFSITQNVKMNSPGEASIKVSEYMV